MAEVTPEEIANEVFAEEEEEVVPIDVEEEASVEETLEAEGEAEGEAEAEETPEEETEEDEIPIEMDETNYMEIMESNIMEMMQYQKNLFQDEEYARYNAFLHQYFAKETKKTKVNRGRIPEGYLLTSRANKSNKTLIIPSVVVDLHRYHHKLKSEMDRILFEIMHLIESPMIQEEDHVKFDELKSKYISYRKQAQEIDQLDIDFRETCRGLEEKIASQAIELKVIASKRKLAYEAIPSPVSHETKRKIMDFYKSSGLEIPDAGQINQFSKEQEISTETIEHLLAWIDASQAYVKKDIEYKETLTQLHREIIQHEAIFQFFILQKPRIQRS